jgi:hypothetical protein
MKMNKAHSFSLEFPSGYFTLAEFNAWVEHELNAAKAAWLSYGDVFKAEAVQQPTLVERVYKTVANKHDIYLTQNNVRHSNWSSYISITGLNKLRSIEGVTELNITYETSQTTYKALIPMSAIESGQNSITITMRSPNEYWGNSGYHPNRDTKWGSYFKPV